MKPEHEQTLSLLVDGERVDPESLSAALAEPDSTRVLVDYARLHRAVLDDAARPRAAFYERIGAELAAPARTRLPWRTSLAAAALVVVSVLAGVWAARATLPERTIAMPVVMPQPAPTVSDARGTAPLMIPPGAVPDCPASGPPAPHRVVRLTILSESRSTPPAGGNTP